MPETDALEPLSSPELHDLAVHYAIRHLDLGFFWKLLEIIPAAEAASGHLDKAEADVMTLRARLDDLTDAGKGDLAEALRPYYLEYLREHDVTPRS